MKLSGKATNPNPLDVSNSWAMSRFLELIFGYAWIPQLVESRRNLEMLQKIGASCRIWPFFFAFALQICLILLAIQANST